MCVCIKLVLYCYSRDGMRFHTPVSSLVPLSESQSLTSNLSFYLFAVKFNLRRITISNKREMFSSRLKLWIFLGLSIIWLLSTPVRSQEKEDYEYQEPEPIEKTTIATEVLNTVTQAPASTVQPVFSKEDIYIITIVALLALIVALSIGWYLHCRYMLVAENFKIDIEKGPDTEQPKVAPAEISQNQDPPECSKAISERQKKKDKKNNKDKKVKKEKANKEKKKKAQKNKDVCANTTEQK
ncbi:hypothetical protein XELAEV_18045388mg [Xenopus laevis]|uniref:Uncharacterized protein n=1 Tax=Xenopus laevis TaxID=8355 RepID=A0A974C0L9_XENLA|nr:hypothetical protein XELAEV_18045388mg [Xenopus laevis]